MKTLKLFFPGINFDANKLAPIMVIAICLLSWKTLPVLLRTLNPTVGLLDTGIWQLLLFSIITYLALLLLSTLLFNGLVTRLAMPKINTMVLQFNTLTLWQQLGFYWASFALLLAGALLCLIAIF